MLCKRLVTRSRAPTFKRLSRPEAVIIVTIKAIPTIDINERIFSIYLLSPEINLDRIVEPIMGRKKNQNIDFANWTINAVNPASLDFAKTRVVNRILSMYKKSLITIDFRVSLSFEKRLKMNPATMGRIIIFRISSIMLQNFTSIYCPPSHFISKGVTRGESSVEIAPIVTANARLALARNDITFDANPLGTQPIKMIPAEISGGKWKRPAIVKPTRGIII